jgi:O-antigen ligase
MSKFWREWQHPIEFALLLLFVLFLPLREAPKNLFWAAYVAAWVINRARARGADGAWRPAFGPRWGAWDTLLLAWLASGYLAAMFGGIHRGDNNEVLAVNDMVKYIVLLWCLLRGGYTRGEAMTVLAALVGSCVIAEVEALWNWKVAGKRPALELFSVGQVNHSAIYMTICTGIAASLALAYWRVLATRWRVLLGGAGLLLLAGLFLTGSRAATVVAIALVLCMAALGARVAGLGRAVWGAAVAVIVAAILIGGTSALQRQYYLAANDSILTERDLIWNRGIVAWRATPWFGVGPDNYSQINERDLRTQLTAESKPFEPREYRGSPHAHNLYINQLVERGIVGLALLLAVLGAWGVALWRYRPRAGIEAAVLALWGASFSGWLVTVSIGMVNTTLHHEHALLALMTLGLWLAALRTARQTARA